MALLGSFLFVITVIYLVALAGSGRDTPRDDNEDFRG